VIDTLVPGDMAAAEFFGGTTISGTTFYTSSQWSTLKSRLDTGFPPSDTVYGPGANYRLALSSWEMVSGSDPSHLRATVLLVDRPGDYYSDLLLVPNRANNITYYVIGLGSAVDTDRLQHIATETGGKYYAAATAADLPAVFDDIAADLRTPPPDLKGTDTDGDGLPDALERGGILDQYGKWYYTNPDDPDTDADGIPDGVETGALFPHAVGTHFFRCLSDPTKADGDGDGLTDQEEYDEDTDPFYPDSDNDGLIDPVELQVGTDPWNPDTDGDTYSDREEYLSTDFSPLISEERYGPLEIARDFVLGAVLGEWGNNDETGIYYMAGWLTSGFLAIGDIRDLAGSVAKGDGIGVILNAVALIPLYGDAERVLTTVGEYVVKHPDELETVTFFLLKNAKYEDNVGDTIKLLREVHGDELIDDLIKNHEIPEATIAALSKGGKQVLPNHLSILLKKEAEKGFRGTWSPGKFGDATTNLMDHWIKHYDDLKKFGCNSKEDMVTMAVDLMRKEEGVEVYIDTAYGYNKVTKSSGTLVKYERATGKYVVGDVDGNIRSLYKLDDPETLKNTARFIRLK
jgi:hypothetical protein